MSVVVPDGCECDPDDWAHPDRIPPVCARYDPMSSEPLCRHCEHMEECHGD